MGSLSTQQIDLVRKSWALLKPKAARFTDVLYEELFSAEPQLRILFEGPMDEQHMKLEEAITLAVETLDDPAAFKAYFHELGERHGTYGVRPYHYEAMAGTFDRTLERMAGANYTAEVREAWMATVRVLLATMQEKT